MTPSVHIPDIEVPSDAQVVRAKSQDNSDGTIDAAHERMEAKSCEAKLGQEHLWENRFVHWWLLGISTAVILLSFLMRSNDEKRVYLPLLKQPLPEICYAKRILNLDCPGCGMTRCFINLSHGHVAKAWHFNPAGFLVYGLIAFQIPFQSLQLWRIYHNRRPWRIPNWEIVFYVLAAMMIVTWGVKLISIYVY